MKTPIDRKRALPDVTRTSLGVAASTAALILMTAGGVACAPPEEPARPGSTPAPMAPVPSPDGTAVSSMGGVEMPPPAAPAPALSPAPAEGQAEPPAVEAEPPPAREPKMEWHEGSARTAAEGGSSGSGGKHVFTNADLARFATAEEGSPSDAVAADRKAQEAFDKASAKKVQDLPATDAWKAKTKADAEERVRAAEARLDALRRLSQSEANPLLPQPILSTEEQKKREGLSAEQRYKLTQQQIQQAEQELSEAKADLARILKNFAPPR